MWKQIHLKAMLVALGFFTLMGPGLTAPQKIEVSSMDELVKSIGPNRTLVLKPGLYHLSDKTYPETPYVRWKQNNTLTLRNLSNLRLVGSGLEQTQLANQNCGQAVFDFESVAALRLEAISFSHLSLKHGYPLDCETSLRGQTADAAARERAFLAQEKAQEQKQKIQDWQRLATRIVKQKVNGVELPEYTKPLYPELLAQVQAQTRMILPEWDGIAIRQHSIRPRVGLDYEIKERGVYRKNQPAQVAAVVFDRSHNLVVALDASAEVILAFEARNNTRFSWDKSPQWLMSQSIVPESNAPAPNGVYAIGSIIKDNPLDGGETTFGSYRILTRGGTIYRRQILFHSRDRKLNQEIPWGQDINDKEIRTLGCFLMQDPDLRQLAQVLSAARAPVALVVQGRYDKNIVSPAL